MSHTETTGSAMAPGHPSKTVTITVNNVTVELPKEELTGAEIKAAAIAAGVSIEPSFVLSVQKHGDRYEVVGDQDVIKVHQGLDFTAVAPDDNS